MQSDQISQTEFYVNELQQCIAGIKTEELKQIAEVFSLNIDATIMLFAMPLTLLYSGKVDAARIGFYALTSIQNVGKNPKERLEVDKTAENRVLENKKALMSEAKEMLNRMENDGDMKNALLILDYAVLTSSWTAFESMAKDAWVAALNKYPIELGKVAFECAGVRDEDPFKDKKVPISLLAKERFDLRKSLGTLAASRFDFKNCRGIKAAYKVVFSDEADLAIFSSADLNTLEAIRHVIVHRAGYIDHEFLKRTHSTRLVGERLRFSAEEKYRYINTVIRNGCSILNRFDDIITKLVSGNSVSSS